MRLGDADMSDTLTREEQLVLLEAVQLFVNLVEEYFVHGHGVPSTDARLNLARAITALQNRLPLVRARLMGQSPSGQTH